MANTYVVTSASYIPGISPNPTVTIIGSVNGIAVTVTIDLDSIVIASNSGGITAVKNVVAPLMLQQSIINAPPAPQAPVQLPTGTFTQ